MRGAFGVALLLAITPYQSRADLPKVQPRTHAEFMKGCQEAVNADLSMPPEAMVRAVSCFEYVRGVMDSLGISGPVKVKNFSICETGQTPVLVVIRRMVALEIDNPDIANGMTDRLSVAIALSQLSPCKK